MSYKIDEIDYSKNDQIDINNRLSRIGRNNMGETSKAIKDLDDDDKSTAEKNLSIYGAELVNNLKQINYTFRQLEDYVFVPLKESKKGSKKLVEDIRKPPPPPPSPDEPKDYILEFDFSESKEDGPVEETKEGDREYQNYFATVDNYHETDDIAELKREDPIIKEEIYRIKEEFIRPQLIKEGFDIFGDEFLRADFSDDNEDKYSPYLKELFGYYYDLKMKEDVLNSLIERAKYDLKTKIGTSGIEELKKEYDDSIVYLAEKFEEAGVEIPPEGITPPFVKENEDVLDEEGLTILNEVKKMGKELSQAEEEETLPTKSVFTDPTNPDIEYLKGYTFLDESKTYTPQQIKEKKKIYDAEYDRITGLSEEEDKNRKGTKSPAYNALTGYLYKLMTEGPKYQTIKILEQAESPPITEYGGITFPSKKADLTLLRDMIDGNAPIKEIRDQLFSEGFRGNNIDKLKKPAIIIILEKYESAIPQGSGRYRGGVKRAPKTPTTPKIPRLTKKSKALLTQITPTPTTPTPTPTTPIISNDDTDGDEEVEREQITNFDVAKKLEDIMKAIQNTNQKSPLPAYQNKIDELMTGLVQFIGRTTVLFISKLKKNLKYLDEDLSKQIYDEIPKFKRNLEILRNHRNKSDKLIKYTLYDQVEKETIGLYNLINDSIRNFSKLKNYTSLEPLQGGYFIESSNPFIRQCLNKRFL